jgi:lipopolysaccharide transport protein LptA
MLLALVVALCGSQQLAHTAAFSSRGMIDIKGTDWDVNISAGTLSLRSVHLTQPDGTLIKAEEGAATGIDEGYENSNWELRGNVHVEYEGTVLDADAAAVSFADGRLKSVQVQGGPAQFAHTARQTGRRSQGRAANISYDAPSGQVRFSSGTWFSDGRAEYTGEQISYNVITTILSDDGNRETRETLTLQPKREDRVPPPREPERGAAQ